MLWHVVNRIRRVKRVDDVVVATTTKKADQAIVSLCKSEGWLYFRGSEEDVLDRYYRAAVYYGADTIVRITSDCPLIEPEIVDLVIEAFLNEEADYASNTLPPRTYPRGLDAEVFSFAALERAWKEDADPALREHVTPYLYRHPDEFKLTRVAYEADLSYMRWTVDTGEDLTLVSKIYDCFDKVDFTWEEALEVLKKHPDWLEINKDIKQKVVP
jgi:spore coat polysaccharide biosynthesis protein SpsF